MNALVHDEPVIRDLRPACKAPQITPDAISGSETAAKLGAAVSAIVE
jgi:hypothetical protein